MVHTPSRSIGVISDTHGLLRPEATAALAGVDRILHAGDVGRPEVLAALGEIAPTLAVRGNNDRGPWAESLPLVEVDEVGPHVIYMMHELAHLDVDPAGTNISVIVTGHSHRPSQSERDGVLYLDPGSAGPRRFKLPVSVARLHFDATGVRSELIELEV